MQYDYENYEGFKTQDISILYDSSGKALTQALFRETITKTSFNRGFRPHYTLREREKEDLPSAYQIYIHSVDEYDAAMKLVGSMRHWRKLCELPWFLYENTEYGFTGLLQWRQDMRTRDEYLMKKVLMNKAQEGSVSAATALYKDSQAPKKKTESSSGNSNNKRGRPQKDKDEYEEDLSRLQLISGGKDE